MDTSTSAAPERTGLGPRLAAAVALVALPLIYFFPAVINQVALVPGDGLTQNFGVRVLIGQMIAHGTVPLWNPYIFAGTPLLASIYPGALYPPNWLFALLRPEPAMQWVVITTYHIALIGSYLYGRRIGMSRVGAFICGITFTFGGYMIAHLGHTSRIAAGAWLPWLMLAVEEVYQRTEWRAAWRWVAGGALIIALQLFAGEPQMNCYTGLVVGAYVLGSFFLRSERDRRWRFAARVAMMSIGGVLLSAIQLLPERELLREGERAHISYEYFSQYSFPPRQVFTLIFPYFFGGAGMDPYKVAYWGEWSLSEVCGYAGMLALLTAFAAALGPRRRMASFWACVAVGSLVLSFGAFLPFNLNYVLYHVPIYNLFRASGRHMFEFTFAVGVLAGLGVSALTQLERSAARTALRRGTLALAASVALTTIAYRFFWPSRPADANLLSNPDAWIPLVFFALSAAAVWLYARRPNAWLGAVMVAVLLADLASFGAYFEWRLLPYGDLKVEDPVTVKAIKEREPDWNSFRVVSYAKWPYNQNYRLLNHSNLSIAHGLQSVNGYDALRLPRPALMGGDLTIDGIVQDFAAFNERHQGFNLLNVKYVLAERLKHKAGESGGGRLLIDGVAFNPTELNQRLGPNGRAELSGGGAAATELVVVSNLGDAPHVTDDTVVAELKLHTKDGRVIEAALQAGRDTAEWAYDRPDVRAAIQHRRSPVAESWPVEGFDGHRFLARFEFPRAEINRVEVKYALKDAALHIVRASLFDAATGISTALDDVGLPADKWRKLGVFGEVELYENTKVLPRAWFVGGVKAFKRRAVLEAIRSGNLPDGSSFDPAETALFETEDFGLRPVVLPPAGKAADARVHVTRYEPQRIELETHNAAPGLLVLSEIWYRGWEAWIDGRRAPVERVNYALRGLAVPAGDHRVEFVFRAHSFRNGAAWSLFGVALLLVSAGAGRYGAGPTAKRVEASLNRVWTKVAARVGNVSRTQWLTALGIILPVIYCAMLIKHASYTVGGSDSSGYANLARSLLHGPLVRPVAELEQFSLPESFNRIFIPLGYIPGRQPDTMSPTYPIGLPLHLAAATLLGGEGRGPFWIAPLTATLSLLLLYLVGLELGLSRVYAVAGAALLAVIPVFVLMGLQAMSDVPATCWSLLTIWAALKARRREIWALLAGAAFGGAFLLRPSSVLLLLVIPFCLPWKPKTLLFFLLGGLPLAAIFGGFNLVVYGHPLQTGYMAQQHQDLMTFSGFRMRFGEHFYWTVMTMSPLLLLGWLGTAVNRGIYWRDRALLLVWFAAFLLFYACYDIYGDWWYGRFLLPAFPALILGTLLTVRSVAAFGARFVAESRRALVSPVAVAVLLLIVYGFAQHYLRRYNVFGFGRGEVLHAESCRWVDRTIPKQSLVVAMETSGAMDYYTDRAVVRYDWASREQWQTLKVRAGERGYGWYALMWPHEVAEAQTRLPGKWSKLGMMRHLSLWRIEPTPDDELEIDEPLAAPTGAEIRYGAGFAELEQGVEGAVWRWMEREGVVELKNTGEPMKLEIKGRVPLEAFRQKPIFSLHFNGALLERTPATEQFLQRSYTITPAQQGRSATSELRLSADKWFVPQELDASSGDQRRLAFSLARLTWRRKPTP